MTQLVTTASLSEEFAEAPAPDLGALATAQARRDDILRPPGALHKLDEIALWAATWQRTATPSISRPAALIFAGDHGVTVEGVSAFPADVTAAMLAAFRSDRASISALARTAGASVKAIDVGVGRPTGNLRVESAMSPDQFSRAFNRGRQEVRDLDTDLLIVGEMGIGNSTAAAAVCAALLGGTASEFTGRGTGMDDRGLSLKARVVEDALHRIEGQTDPLEILRELGGTELSAMAGAMFEARMRSTPLLLDGYIATTPALTLHAIDRAMLTHARAAHCSAEPGHTRVLEHLGLEPLLTLDMHLGEASGAMAAVPLVEAACRLLVEVPTFTEWFAEAP